MSDFAAPPLPGTAVIALAAMGSYAAGGRQVQVTGADRRAVSLSSALSLDHDPNGTFWIDQAYVQYFVPIARRCPLPVLMIHGGGMTGRTWETTPDGRPGWLQRFVQAGFETHVVDIAERGRAGNCPALLHYRCVIPKGHESSPLVTPASAQKAARMRTFRAGHCPQSGNKVRSGPALILNKAAPRQAFQSRVEFWRTLRNRADSLLPTGMECVSYETVMW
jgi:hypothetical protein